MGGPGAHEDLPPRAPVEGLKVGSLLWQFDANRRVYRKDGKGRSIGSPSWREHWQQVEIVSETRMSWLIDTPGSGYLSWSSMKIAKKDFRDGKCPSGYALSEEQIDREAWVCGNAYHLGQLVARCGDYDTLKKIAEMVGYEDREPSK